MSILDSPRWYRALSLNERIALPGDPLESDTELGRRRMGDWRQQTDLGDAGPFAAYLETLGIDEARFIELLGESDASLKQRADGEPEWLKILRQYYADDCTLPPMSAEFRQQFQEHEILVVAAPVLTALHQRLLDDIQQTVAGSDDIPFDIEWLRYQFYEQFLFWMLWVMRRPMILEINISRMEKQFPGDTSEARYRAFIQHYSQAQNALSILEQYPLMARKIVEQVDTFVTSGMQFIRRLLDDYAKLGEYFFSGAPGQLSDIALNLSDPHRNGKRVFKLTFEHGRQLIYKPKSQAVDVCYQQLLTYINQHRSGDVLSLQTLKIMDRGDYGWVECAMPEPCRDQDELDRFYHRQGMNMALLYLLNANDFHYENLIACGEHPVLVDLETLYQPRITDPDKARIHLDAANATVLALGLLPYQTGFIGNRKHEIGGLGGAGGQSLTVRQLTGFNTDEMQFALQEIASTGAENLPELDGKTADIWSMRETIAVGFTAMYQWLLAHREALLANDGPLADFAQATVRTIFRGTEQYSALASAVWHPDIVQNALFKDRLWAKLWRRGYQNSLYRRIYPHEIQDMERGDVPLFSTLGNSCDVQVSDDECLTDIFDETGEQAVLARLRELDPSDLHQQVWLILGSLDTQRPEHLLRTYAIDPLPDIGHPDTPRQALLDEAEKIGERLAGLMLTYLDQPTWFDFKLVDAEQRLNSLQPMSLALYDGLSGMLIFFEHLAKLTRSQRMADISGQVLTRTNQVIDDDPALPQSLGNGGYSGWPGIVYTYTHLAGQRGDPKLLDYAQRLLHACQGTLDEPDDFDLIGGAAGTLLTLSHLYQQTGEPQHLALAQQLADWLVNTAVAQSTGVAWVNAATQQHPLTGLAHGAAGPALALTEAAVALQRPDYLNTVQQALAYEDAWFSDQQQTWLDLRMDRKTEDDQYDTFYAWCHGAPGIGLARLACARRLHGSDMAGTQLMQTLNNGIRTAAQATLANGFGGSHTLCHGDLGNLELVTGAAEFLDDDLMRTQANTMAVRVLENIQANGYRCGGVVGRELTGLMLGLAGIGYGLLKQYAPQRVPSVLLLECD